MKRNKMDNWYPINIGEHTVQRELLPNGNMWMSCGDRSILAVLTANMFVIAQTFGIPFQVIETNLSQDNQELYFVEFQLINQ